MTIAPALVMGSFTAPIASALEPANLRAGPVYVTPTLDARVGYTDNLFRTRDDEESTGISQIKPRVQAWLQGGLNTYSLTYELADYRYFDSSDDDFTDHIVTLDVHHEFNVRNETNLFAEYYNGHEQRGTGLTEGDINRQIDKPLELDRSILGGDYTLGSESATGRLRLGARYTDHQYQNFEEITRDRNREIFDYDATFFWRLAPKTDLLAEVRFADVEYDFANTTTAGVRDSEEYNYFLGVAWEATAKTHGSVRLGMYDRQYDSDVRKDTDGFSWEVDVSYEPRSYSTWQLLSRRYTQETNGFGDAVDTSRTSLSWTHGWTTRARTRLALGAGEEDYSGSVRKDDVYDAKAEFSYLFRRWLDLGLGYRYEDRDSVLDIFSYQRNEVYLEANMSL